MIYLKTHKEIDLMRDSSLLVARTHAELAKFIKPGVTSSYLDKVAEDFIRDNGAVPGFKGYNGFPSTLCVSQDNQVVHGLPSNKEIKEGSILSIDCGVLMNGYYGDSAYTFAVGCVSEEKKRLLDVTKQALNIGVEAAIYGNTTGDIGFAIQQFTESHGYSVVKELVGHGIGKNLHESPEVPNYGKRGSGIKLEDGIVFDRDSLITPSCEIDTCLTIIF
jgi:methionyl aminopeptidase